MQIKELRKELRKLRRQGWVIDDNDCIRNAEGCCPLVAAARRHTQEPIERNDYETARKVLKLRPACAYPWVDAADGACFDHPRITAWLHEDLGLHA